MHNQALDRRRFIQGTTATLAGTWAWSGSAAGPPRHQPEMSWLDNGQIRLGADLQLGGAITYLSVAGKDENVINSWDYGRQVQLSFYGGPVPFTVGDKQPHEVWKHLGWNPIQSGDTYGHHSKVLEHRNDGKSLYVKCVPMQWPLKDVPGDCTFESWLRLDGTSVQATARINNAREDKTVYSARMQELPAVYTNGPYYRLLTYDGAEPFADKPLSRIEKKPEQKGPWAHWLATENWAALVNDQDFGLGVCVPGCVRFSGGFAGKPGAGGPHDDPTGYIAPNKLEILDHNIQYEFKYWLTLDTLKNIRRKAVGLNEGRGRPLCFQFTQDRQSWTLVNATDTGWPMVNEWKVLLEKKDPQLISPVGCWSADEYRKLTIEAAIQSSEKQAHLYWARHDAPHFSPQRLVSFPVQPDGEYHTISVDLSKSPEFKGRIVQFRLDPCESGAAGQFIRLRSFRLE